MLNTSNFLVFDLETGGFWCARNPITEIAIIGVDYQLNKTIEFQRMVKNYDNLVLTPDAKRITGITEEILMKDEHDGIPIIEAKVLYQELVKLFKSQKVGKFGKPVLVGHNASKFDSMFLEYLFDKFEPARPATGKSSLYKYVEEFICDTMWISRMKYGHIEVINHKLGTSCEKEGIIVVDAHRAMNDTRPNAELFIKYMKHLRGTQIQGEESAKSQENTAETRNYQFK